MKAIRFAAVIIAMGYATTLPAADTPKSRTQSETKKEVPAKPESKAMDEGASGADKEKATGERSRKAESPATPTPSPKMQPTDPLNPDPMRPGTPPTFPRNEASPQSPVKPTDPTAPTIVK